MSLLNKPIEEVITFLIGNIKSKRDIINNFKKEYNITSNDFMYSCDSLINVSKIKLMDILNEFEITISNCLQSIETLQAEIFNLKETKDMQKTIEKDLKNDITIDNNKSLLMNTESSKVNQIYSKPKTISKAVKSRMFQLKITNNNSLDKMKKSIYTDRYKNNITSIDSFESINKNKIYNDNYEKDIYNKSDITSNISLNQSDNYNTISKAGLNKIEAANNKIISNNIYNNSNLPKIKKYEENDIYNKLNEIEVEPEVEELKVKVSNKNNIYNTSNINTLSIQQLPNVNFNKENINNKLELNNNTFQNKKELFISKVSQIEATERIMDYLSKISEIKSYKKYLSGKYGNGKYDQFLSKIRKGEIDLNLLEKELKVIYELILTESKRNTLKNSFKSSKSECNITKEKSFSTRNSYNEHLCQKSLQKKYSFNSINEGKYEEPINLANILRSYDTKKKSTKKRSDSSKKKDN